MSTTDTLEGVDVAALFASIDRFDSEAFSAFFAEDATYVFANHPPIQGRDAIVAAAAEFWVTLEGIEHELVQIIPFPGGFVSQLAITFALSAGRTVELPVAVITRTADGLIRDHRIYVDATPLAG